MAKGSISLTSTFSESTATTELGVGLVPNEGGTVPLHTALRARTNGCCVFTTTENLDAELEEALRKLDVVILDVDAESRSDVEKAIVSAAKAVGCGGVVICAEETGIDFNASQQQATEDQWPVSGDQERNILLPPVISQ